MNKTSAHTRPIPRDTDLTADKQAICIFMLPEISILTFKHLNMKDEITNGEYIKKVVILVKVIFLDITKT